MATASKAKAAPTGSMAGYAQAPSPARASAPKKGGARKINGLNISVAENGYTLRKHYDYTGGEVGYGSDKELVFTDVDALVKAVKTCLAK